MKFSFSPLVIFLFLLNGAIAQGRFEKGYILTLQKDTVPGLIMARSDEELAHTIVFTQDINSKSINYDASEIEGFAIGSRKFERKMDVQNSDTSYVFSKHIIEGKLDVFILRQKGMKFSMFVKNNETGKEAQIREPKRTSINKDGSTYIQDDMNYLKRLIYLVPDLNDSKKWRYSENDLKKKIVNYNNKFRTDFPAKVYQEPIRYSYEILLGLSARQTDGTVFWINMYRLKNFTDKSNFFSYKPGLVYAHWKSAIPFDQLKPDPAATKETKNFRWQLLNFLPLGFEFHARKNVVQPFLAGGLGVGTIWMTDYGWENSVYTGIQNKLYPTFAANLTGGIKVNLEKVSIVLQITPSTWGTYASAGISF